MNWIENNFNPYLESQRSPASFFDDTWRFSDADIYLLKPVPRDMYTRESPMDVRMNLDFMSVESYLLEAAYLFRRWSNAEFPIISAANRERGVEMCSRFQTTRISVSTSMRLMRRIVEPALRGADIGLVLNHHQ